MKKALYAVRQYTLYTQPCIANHVFYTWPASHTTNWTNPLMKWEESSFRSGAGEVREEPVKKTKVKVKIDKTAFLRQVNRLASLNCIVIFNVTTGQFQY